MAEEFSVDPARLLEAATDFAYNLGAESDASAEDFLNRFPLPAIINALQTKADYPGLEDALVDCLERIFKTTYGASLIPHHMQFVVVGLGADSQKVRCLACKIVSILLETTDVKIATQLILQNNVYKLMLKCWVDGVYGDEQLETASMDAIKILASSDEGTDVIFEDGVDESATYLFNLAYGERVHTPSNATEGRVHTPSNATEGRVHTPSNATEGRVHTPSNATEDQVTVAEFRATVSRFNQYFRAAGQPEFVFHTPSNATEDQVTMAEFHALVSHVNRFFRAAEFRTMVSHVNRAFRAAGHPEFVFHTPSNATEDQVIVAEFHALVSHVNRFFRAAGHPEFVFHIPAANEDNDNEDDTHQNDYADLNNDLDPPAL